MHPPYIGHEVYEALGVVLLDLAEVLEQAGRAHVVEVLRLQDEVREGPRVLVRQEVLLEAR
jgi:hypothetical protein